MKREKLKTIVEEMVSEVEFKSSQNEFQNPEKLKERMRHQIHDAITDYAQILERGYLTLLSGLKEAKEEVAPFLISKVKLDKIKNHPEGVYQDIVGYSDKQMIHLYEIALERFNGRRYLEAADAFIFLGSLNPMIVTYWLAAAACYEQMHSAQSAYILYRVAIMVDPVKLESWKRAFRCCLGSYHDVEKFELLDIGRKVVDKLEATQEHHDFRKALKELLVVIAKR